MMCVALCILHDSRRRALARRAAGEYTVAGFLVADVIETITVEPTLSSLVSLGILVLLRTFVSWTLTLEVEGRWPWQPAAEV